MLKPDLFKCFSFAAIVFLAFSCANKKKIIYFQGDKAIASDTTKKYSPLYKADDLLSITVMAMDADAVKPFNLNTYGNLSNDKSAVSGNTSQLKGYLIDQNGDIDFPVIGKIHFAGLNRSQASALLCKKLGDYIKDPAAHIELLNFKVTILGDVNKPGNYTIPNERVTLIEAIGMAGDLSISGIRKNVLVLRDNNGVITETRVDLTKKDIFNSPVLYLQQNDVIYVEQNRAKKNSSVLNSNAITLILSFTTLGITLLNLLIR
jgi:polysaccharide export outer membrane protein